MKPFARDLLIAAQTARPDGVAGIRPRDLTAENLVLSEAELGQIAKIWGTAWADCLITDARWPFCNQSAAVIAAGAIVEKAIDGIIRILHGADFAPHVEMMSVTMRETLWNSMPSFAQRRLRCS